MAHIRQTPQQKKQLDYARERRNTYGEAPHGARKSIPRNKRFGHKANRAVERTELSRLQHRAAFPPEGEAMLADERLSMRPENRWRKSPDRALGFVVAEKLARRELRDIPSARPGASSLRPHQLAAWPGGTPWDVRI